MLGNTAPFSYSPGGFSPEDFPQHRRALQQEDVKTSPFQRNDMSRPSGRAIYQQRKEYSETLNRQSESFQVRVEHLFTCEIDGQDVKTLNDCLAKLKTLDTKGRLWPQDMIMDVQGGYLLLSDIETKAELEALPSSSILQTKAVLDSCAFNSLLTVTVQQQRGRRQVFIFQCEETGAELVKRDLDKALQSGGGHQGPRREPADIRSTLENILSQSSFRHDAPPPMQEERIPPPPEDAAPRWNSREPDYITPPRVYTPQEEPAQHFDPHEQRSDTGMLGAFEKTNAERNTEILNHVIEDMETFMDKVAAVVNASSQQEKKKKKKNQKKAAMLPPWQEYVSVLQKIKYGFNLLGQLDGTLSSPSAPEFVHIFFTSLDAIVSKYPPDLPPTVVSPLLTDAAVGLLAQVVSPEEDQLWGFLGESWNIPRSRWPNDDVPPYVPDFYDGWQPPAPNYIPPPYQNGGLSRSSSQHFTPDEGQSLRAMQRQPDEPDTNGSWGLPPPSHHSEPPLYMRAMYDFMARNNQELSIMKGEVVQVIQKSRQWWLVRNSHDQEGNVPQKLLEPVSSGGPAEGYPRDTHGPVTLDMSSSAAEVKAWLEYKGFSKITVSSLGVLTGSLLLGMSSSDIKAVCPEEGGRVFFQLQAVKSAIALASEPSGLYNGRY